MYVKHCRTISSQPLAVMSHVLGTPGLEYYIVKHCRTLSTVEAVMSHVLATPDLDSVGYLKGKHLGPAFITEKKNKTFIEQINQQYRKNRKRCLNIFQLHPTNTYLHTSQYG